MIEGVVTIARRRFVLLIAAAAVAVVIAAPSGARAGTLGTLIDQTDCGDVPGNGTCRTGYYDVCCAFSTYARFTTVNGDGVYHSARLLYNSGSNATTWVGGTAMYVRTFCTGVNNMAAQGWNNSASAHHFTVELFYGCY
jgi:hypothetical protein